MEGCGNFVAETAEGTAWAAVALRFGVLGGVANFTGFTKLVPAAVFET
jgi:hypothetical protein